MINSTKEAEDLVVPFLKMSEEEIYHHFESKFPKRKTMLSIKENCYDEHCSMYIEGTRPDKVALVAHVDTVYDPDYIIDVINKDDVLSSANTFCVKDRNGRNRRFGYGIGADDRAGVAALWYLRNLGHSMLLLSGEERGCIGAQSLMELKEMRRRVQDNQFMVEFDRHGENDLVYYQVGTKEFKRYCGESTGYKKADGTCSDISVLCRDICGVNISIGYENEHTARETLNLNWFMRTINVTEKWLAAGNIPKFKL